MIITLIVSITAITGRFNPIKVLKTARNRRHMVYTQHSCCESTILCKTIHNCQNYWLLMKVNSHTYAEFNDDCKANLQCLSLSPFARLSTGSVGGWRWSRASRASAEILPSFTFNRDCHEILMATRFKARRIQRAVAGGNVS